jgi:hypothetical protein
LCVRYCSYEALKKVASEKQEECGHE